jgi:hypothetical protein
MRRLNPELIMIARVLTGVAIGDGSLAVWDAVASLHLVVLGLCGGDNLVR